ncbi:gamma-glutamyltransferase [Serpentinicella sp. ANB-PHB4]|uniref:gamma-glutamyltransferase n=1 Tax=Serpentinicella sp. ANB-PHB4 TaxID=3074076 RepID=UPI00285BDBE5|nr:gamma-glutamyltransferase [Serpentinicella sp. ANB-PHB4]MDR5658386.1 gamma-glutamyltransferase [Serpentinicella sp. ANB-PHB4]
MALKKGGFYGFVETGRPVSEGTNGAVTSPHYLATQAGKEILEKGGHAVEGAIAVNAVLCVVYPHMAGLGGDLFSLIWDESEGEVKAINGSGRSGSKVVRDIYLDKGYDEIPERGPLSANTVPGTVKAWWDMHQQYGRLEWNTLFLRAIEYAEHGFPVTEKFSQFIKEKKQVLNEYEESRNTFLPGGRAIQPGEILKQPDLALTLKLIAKDGYEVFYKGEVAERIVDSLNRHGGLLVKEDLEKHVSTWEKPLTTDYRDYLVHELKPNTQGIATLMMLNILKEHDIQSIGDNTPDYYHLMAEAAKIAFKYRDQWVTDKRFEDIPYDKLLSKEHGSKMVNEISMSSAYDLNKLEELPDIKGNRDTTYMSVVDKEGNGVSLIQSIYHEFGSGFMPGGCGFLLQNRGSFFSLDPDHQNTLEPNKRTFHTIIPAMATKDGKPFMLFGSMGGEGQPQTQCALLTRVIDFGYNMQQAIEAPRWLYGRTWGESSFSLKLESRIPNAIGAILTERGHEVEVDEDYSQQMGHAQGIIIDRERGKYSAGADPRGDGLALTW